MSGTRAWEIFSPNLHSTEENSGHTSGIFYYNTWLNSKVLTSKCSFQVNKWMYCHFDIKITAFFGAASTTDCDRPHPAAAGTVSSVPQSCARQAECTSRWSHRDPPLSHPTALCMHTASRNKQRHWQQTELDWKLWKRGPGERWRKSAWRTRRLMRKVYTWMWYKMIGRYWTQSQS